MAEVKNILDDVFKKPEPEVRYFSEVMRTPAPGARRVKKHAPSDVTKLDEKVKVKAFEPVKQMSGKIAMEHGWDGADYVWHIEPAPRCEWKVTLDRVIYATAKTMHSVIPDHVYVKIFKPYLDWEVKVVTFKAFGLGDCWNVSKKDVSDLTLKLFEILNPLA